MAPSAGRLQGHLLLLRSLQLLLHSTKIAATVASDSQLAFFPGNTRTPPLTPGGVLSRQVYGSAATAPRSCAVVMASYIRAGGGKVVRALERRYLSSQATLGCPAHDEER